MAKGGRSNFTIDFSELVGRLELALTKVERGTKRATTAACMEILADSLQEVPMDTTTLAKSGYVEVRGKYKNFEGIIGYGGNGDPINPKTGEKASKYVVAVHEDLNAKHPIGKAKFLEDPVRRYQAKFAPNAAEIIRQDLEG